MRWHSVQYLDDEHVTTLMRHPEQEMDPNNLLLFVQGVNSESWNSEQICLIQASGRDS